MTTLNYDNQGFIIGMSRMSRGIDNVHDDTQEIVQILKSQNQIANTKLSELTRAVQNASRLGAQNNDRNRSTQNNGAPDSPLSEDTPQDRARNRRANINARRASRTSGSNNPANNSNNERRRTGRPTISRTSDNAADRARSRRTPTNPNGGSNNPARERDANGRFAGSSQSASQAALGRMMAGFKGVTGTGNVGGVDPVLDSLKEAKDLLSPLGRAAKLGGRAVKFSFSKLKAMKRREPLPIDQDRHNRENEKLLDKIWKAIRKTGERGGGLLGGLLGGAGGRGGRGGRGGGRRGRGALGRLRDLGGRGLRAVGGIKGLGIAGAVAGAASLGMDWKGLNKEEKTERIGQAGGGAAGALIGGTIGSVVPVVGTAIGAVVGGYLGAKGGAVIAQTVDPHVSGWTSSLKGYNLAGKMDTFWKAGMTPVFSTFADLGRSMRSWLGDMYSKAKEKFGIGGGGGGGGGEPAGDALKAADYAIKNAANESLGKCAEYVNNAFQEQGLKASGHGVDVATNLRKGNAGKFEDVAYDENYAPKVGDVMSMPSSKKSKHNYGHVAVYTDQGWVSDYKQGEKYGNTAAPNQDYYEDIQSGRIKPTISRMINNDAPAGGKSAAGGDKEKTAQAMKYFMSQGWTKQQAAGLTGNLQKESQFDHTAVGDGGKAYGVAQWHPDRQANFKAKYGKNIKQSSYAEQLAFVNHELTNGTEKGAGNRLRQAKTAAQAGAIVSEYYERPANKEGEKRERAAIATNIDRNHSVTLSKASKAKPTSSATGFSLGDMKAANNIAPTSNASNSGYGAASFAPTPMLKIPAMPKVTQRLDSGSSDKPLFVQSSNDSINQNVSDRDLAHAITGGLGQSRQWA